MDEPRAVAFAPADPFRHGRVVALQNRRVPGEAVRRPGADHPGIAPCRLAARAVVDVRGRVGEGAIRPLRVVHVHAPLAEEGRRVEVQTGGFCEDLRVAGPAQPLVALRTVRWNVEEIALLAPDDAGVKTVDPLVGTREVPGARHVGMKHHADHVLPLRTPGNARQLDVAKTVKGEVRLEQLFAAAADVPVGAFRRAQVFRVERAFGVEHLGVADDDLAPAGLAQPDARQARHVLPEVEDEHARTWLGEPLRRQLLLRPDRHAPAGHQGGLGRREQPGGRPHRIIEPRFAPPAHLQPRVVVLAIVEVGAQNRPRGRLPRFVSRDPRPAAIRMLDFDLHQQRELLAIPESPAESADAAGVPAVAEDRANGVLALAEVVGDVVGRDLDAPAVVGPARREAVASHAPAVEVQLEHAARRHICPGPDDAPSKHERPAQMRAGPSRLQRTSDPRGPPVGLAQESHFKRGRFAPVRHLARRVPDAHAPEHALARAQLRTLPRDADAVSAADLPRVPQVGLRIQQFRCARRDDLPRRLMRPGPGILHAPREPRRRFSDPDGIDAVLGLQFDGFKECHVFCDPILRRFREKLTPGSAPAPCRATP